MGMRFCLLKADYVNDNLLDKHGDLPDMFEQYMENVVKAEWETFELRFGEFPNGDNHYDAIFISGSRYSVNANLPWVATAQNYIRSISDTTTIIGHCFGHQLLASSFGGTVQALPTFSNVGLRTVNFVKRPAWEPVCPENMSLLFNHSEQVVGLPNGAVVLAGDDICATQMIHYRPNVIGIQAHPEYTVSYQEALMELNAQLPSEEITRAKNRNGDKADNFEAAKLVLNFITSRKTTIRALST